MDPTPIRSAPAPIIAPPPRAPQAASTEPAAPRAASTEPAAPQAASSEPAAPRDLTVLSSAERAFVEQAVADARFGPKNAFILNRFFGYPVSRPVDPAAFIPPRPVLAPPGSVPLDPALAAKARTFDQIVSDARATGGVVKVPVEGTDHVIQVSGLSPSEVAHVTTALEAIPPWARAFLKSVNEICVAHFEAFKADDGSVSDLTTGVAEAASGQLLLNRKWLDFESLHLAPDADDAARKTAREKDDAHWQNTLLHELGHFDDRWQRRGEEPPSRETDSPLGNHGVWYTNYAWLTQDPAEDLAEGFAILGQARYRALHPPQI